MNRFDFINFSIKQLESR